MLILVFFFLSYFESLKTFEVGEERWPETIIEINEKESQAGDKWTESTITEEKERFKRETAKKFRNIA